MSKTPARNPAGRRREAGLFGWPKGFRSTGLFRFQNRVLEKKAEMLYNNRCKYKQMRMAVLNSEQKRPTGRIFADERC